MNPLQTYYDRIIAAVPEAVRVMIDCSMNLWPEYKKDAIFGVSAAKERYSCGVHFHNEAGGGDLHKLKRRKFLDQRRLRRLEIYASKEAFRVTVFGGDLDTVCSVAIESYRSYLAAGRDIDEGTTNLTLEGIVEKRRFGKQTGAFGVNERKSPIVLTEPPLVINSLPLPAMHAPETNCVKTMIAAPYHKATVTIDSEAKLDPKFFESVIGSIGGLVNPNGVNKDFGFWDEDPSR